MSKPWESPGFSRGGAVKCKRCDVEMVEGKVLIELYSGHPDFVGGKVEDIVTVSP